MAFLLTLKGSKPGERVPLNGDRIVLGRDPSCDIVIAGNAVSRKHARINQTNGQYAIEDGDGAGNPSRNKTFVNNEEVPFPGQVVLHNNDRIKICDFLCTFHDSKPWSPGETADEEGEGGEETEPPSSVEAAVSHLSSNLLLEAQPAEKLKAILDISSALSKTLELEQLLPKMVDALFNLFKQADRGFIILWDEATKKLIPKVIKTRRPQDEANARFSRSIVRQCVENVQALLSDDAAQDKRFAMSQSIADFSIRSVMCAPLWTQGDKAVGVIQVDTQDRRKKFTQDDLNLLIGVASQASIALENAKLHQQEVARARLDRDLQLARDVQRSFLPSQLPEVPGYEFFAYYESALEVSGDYYDFVPLPGGRLGIMLGDVAGKGVAAALLMAKFSADARSCLLTNAVPAVAVTQLNTGMHQSGLTDRFVTLAAAVVDPATHSVTLVNAGHPSPMLRRASGELLEAAPKEVAGLPIGVLDGYEYGGCEIRLEPGDTLLIFSDGVPDAMDIREKAFGSSGIEAAIAGSGLTARALGERVVKAVKQHAAGRSQFDDITLVAFGRLAEGS